MSGVTLQREGAVVVLSLNRPERHNALVPALLSSLLAALESDACCTASAIVLRAEGRSFSTGGDLLGFQQHIDSIAEYAFELVGLLNKAIIGLYFHPLPVICSVQGQVTGGSVGLLLAANRVLMSRRASITPWYNEVGFSPDGGWTGILPLVIGHQQVTQWLSTNASYNATDCLELGLVDRVTEGECDTAALAWAQMLATGQDSSVSHTPHRINLDAETLLAALEAERKAFVAQIQTSAAPCGIEKFLRRHDHA